MNRVLFVYGTLVPGAENAHIMDGMDGKWCEASVRGTRYDTGWGTHKKHPGFIPDANGEIINGLVFISDDLPAHWPRLDKFEGKNYKRVPIRAILENGETISAQIYQAVQQF